MKKNVLVLAAFLMAAAVPAVAELSQQEQVICNLAAKNCLNQADILQKRVKKLQGEVNKGKTAYSPEELKNLEQKLKETNDLLDKLEGKKPAK
jgi:transposase-like protein